MPKIKRAELNYKRRLFLYFLVVFGIFTLAVIAFEQWRERDFRVEKLSSTLNAFSYAAELNPTATHLPNEMRVTIIDRAGKVLFDNGGIDAQEMENHSSRPEIIGASATGTGYNIRTSTTTGDMYFYHARKNRSGEFIRVALPYDDETKSQLNPDNNFLLFALMLFLPAMLLLWLIARRFGRDLEHLKLNLTREVQARAQLKAEMTSAIAHELRTPTSAIRGYSETLCEEGIDDAHRDQFIRRIHSASLRLSELLENVSLLSKMEEAASKFTSQEVDVARLAEEVVEEFQGMASKSGAKVICDIPHGVVVSGSKTLIYSVWRNLVENALKYSGGGATIELKLCSEDSDFYYFAVKDNGSGVDEKHLPRLFERFYRVESGRTRDDGGSGLGLSIVAHAVQHHGGEVTAKSKQGEGLEVNFNLRKG